MVLLPIAACHRKAHSPSVLYEQAREQFERGNLVSASEQAHSASKEFSADTEWAWRFRILEAEALLWRGLAEQTTVLLHDPLPTSLAQGELAVRYHLALGVANFYLQNFDVSDHELSAADDLAKTRHPELLGQVAQSQGTVATFRNDHKRGDLLFHRALDIAEQQNQPFFQAVATGSIGLSYMRRAHYDEAIDWLTVALSQFAKIDNQYSVAKVLGNLGWCYYEMGDLEQALALSQKAEELSSRLGVLRDQGIWLNNIGSIHFNMSEYDSAAIDLQRSLALARKLQNRSLIAYSLTDLASLKIKQKDFGSAEKYNAEGLAIRVAAHDRAGQVHSLLNSAWIAVGTGNLERAQADFKQAAEQSGEDVASKWQAQAGLAHTAVLENHSEQASRDFQGAMTIVDNARSQLHVEEHRLSFVGTATSLYNDYIDFLVSQNRNEDALAVAEHSRARTLAEGLGIRPASLEDKSTRPMAIARRQHAVILAYWLKPGHSYLWVITPNKVALFKLPADTEINAAVQAYRKALTGPRDPLETGSDSGQQLYQMLVAPAANLIPANSRVVIIADGSLYGLNFETLLATAPKLHYWIDDVTISNANSLAMLRASPDRKHDDKPSLLLIGNPVSASPDFPALPQAQQEIHEVAAHFSSTGETVIDGPKATPAAYLASDPANFSYIHFVAHGTASRLSPLDSAVILSPQGDTYKLYARDIVEKPLRADLVTISACYGSGSRSYSGEGLVGLSWAFLRAGARNVIASLWEANDVSTPGLMDSMYTAISNGDDPAAALHAAKVAMLHSGSVYRRPFYWATFQIYVGPGQRDPADSEPKTVATKSGAGKTR